MLRTIVGATFCATFALNAANAQQSVKIKGLQAKILLNQVVGVVLRQWERYMRRRYFLKVLAGAAAVWPILAHAQTYPSRTITIVVGYAAGGPTDAIARIMAEGMRQSLGQAIIIENVTGASGSIGTGRVRLCCS